MKAILKACALAAITLAYGAAHAADNGFYVGGTIGKSQIELDDSLDSSDDSDTGYKLFGGYKFNKDIAVEVVYFDFGKASARAGGRRADYETSAFGAGVSWTPHFSPDWMGVFRLGLASVKADANYNFKSDVSDSKIKPYVGLGVGYNITPQINVQATWDFTRAEIDDDGDSRVDLFGVGVTFSF